jgi:hypothetical protein
MATNVDVWFDPFCPWTWAVSRWVTEVAPARDLRITWHTFSLWHRNEWTGHHLSDDQCERLIGQYGGLRVLEAARAGHGEEAVARLYTAIGTRIHHNGDRTLRGLAGCVAACGLPASLLDAVDDISWDPPIYESTRRGTALVGEDVGIPIVAIEGGEGRTTFFGPVLAPAPTGEAALRLWDAFVALGEFDGLYEIKRSRRTGPQFGPRPEL